MNIAYIANVRLPTEKAHGYQIMKMCEAFAESGATIELVVPFRKNEIQSDPFDYWGIKRNFAVVTIGGNDLMQYKFIPRKVAFLVNALFFVISAARYIFVHNNSDIIYTRDREVALLSLFFKRKFVWEVHFLPRAMFAYNFIFERSFLLITITGHLKRFLIERGVVDKKIIVSPDAVDISKFTLVTSKEQLRKELELPQDKCVILYAGQFLQWKGVDTLTEASKYLDANYLVVMLGGSDSDIERLSRTKNDNIKFISRVASDAVPRWLMAADILVLPNSARYKISKYYTSPLKLFEYMASGVPMVASDLPSLREVVSEKEAFFFEPDNSTSLARTIENVVKNKDQARARAARAQQKVRQYTWNKRAQNICDILKNNDSTK